MNQADLIAFLKATAPTDWPRIWSAVYTHREASVQAAVGEVMDSRRADVTFGVDQRHELFFRLAGWTKPNNGDLHNPVVRAREQAGGLDIDNRERAPTEHGRHTIACGGENLGR